VIGSIIVRGFDAARIPVATAGLPM